MRDGFARLRRPTLCGAFLFWATMIGAQTKIPCLSGFVRDANGQAVGGADLDFTNAVTGLRLITPGDNTDASGFYSVCVLPGVYHVSYAPPPGTNLRGKLVESIDLRADAGVELDVVLEFGSPVSGIVTDMNGQPVGDVDVDVDSTTGGRIYTPDDNTDIVSGAYRVVVPNGSYQFSFEPPVGSRMRGLQVDSVTVNGPRTLDVTLQPGLLLTGRVRDVTSGIGVFDVDIGLRDAFDGSKIYLANNSTDADGDYSVAVPFGEFELRIEPPRQGRQIAQAIRPFAISTDRSFDVDLESGHRLRVFVVDSSGSAVVGADLDVKRSDTGEKLFTPYDRSDPTGETVAVVATGTYDVFVDPPLGSALDRATRTQVHVEADADITIALPELIRLSIPLRVVDAGGAPVSGVEVDAYILPQRNPFFLPEDLTDVDGRIALGLVAGRFDLTLAPPPGSRLAGHTLSDVEIFDGVVLSDAVLASGFVIDLNLTTADGIPVAGVDVDFIERATGKEMFTPRDDSDVNGDLSVVVVGGVYDLLFEAPAGSGLRDLTIPDYVVEGDRSDRFAFAALPREFGPVRLLPSRPNPFRESTEILYDVDRPGVLQLRIYDVAGRLVASLSALASAPGPGSIVWDGTDQSGTAVASGSYFVRIDSGAESATQKLVHLD